MSTHERRPLPFSSGRDLTEHPELIDKLYYYTYLQGLRGDLNERSRVSLVANEILRERLDKESKGLFDLYEDSKVESLKKYQVKKVKQNYDRKPTIAEVVKILKDNETFFQETHARNRAKPTTQRIDTIEGMAVTEKAFRGRIVLDDENAFNFYRYVYSTGQEDVDFAIILWLTEFLNKALSQNDKDRINYIKRTIEQAKASLQTEELVSNAPEWYHKGVKHE